MKAHEQWSYTGCLALIKEDNIGYLLEGPLKHIQQRLRVLGIVTSKHNFRVVTFEDHTLRIMTDTDGRSIPGPTFVYRSCLIEYNGKFGWIPEDKLQKVECIAYDG